MMSASFGRGPVIAGRVVACGAGVAFGVAVACAVGVGGGGLVGLGGGVASIAVGDAGAAVGSGVAGSADAAGGTGAGVVCVACGVRVQAKPMTASETVRMTQGAIAERGARRPGFFFRGTTPALRALARASLFAHAFHPVRSLVHARGQGAKPFPLVVSRGWPGLFVEMLDLVPRLTDPAPCTVSASFR
jgi:hypothetical protein